jgi:transcriptional regulator with XRE-family HTH domain
MAVMPLPPPPASLVLPPALFAALLARASVSQAGFAYLAGVTPGQVNRWARGHATMPRWAGLLAVVLREQSPETLLFQLDKAIRAGWTIK